MAGTEVGNEGGDARSRSANIALYRRKSGREVSSKVFWRAGIEGLSSDCGRGGAGSIEEKSL